MYLDYFGFTCDPFSICPDPHFVFLSSRHREALAHLLYGTQSAGGFVLLTGEVGTGKTTICRCLLEQLPENTEVVLLWNPRLSVVELLASICDELHISYPPGTLSIKVFIDGINGFLLEAHSRGHRTIIVIDEAQNLHRDVLEQIRLLTNLETNTHKLLQIILLGQPELQEMLSRPELRQLAQRITARYHLLPLSPKDVEGYMAHRLAVAGVRLPVFPPSTIPLIYTLSGGVPRVINIICSRALLGAYAQGDDSVSPEMLRTAAREVFGATPGRRVAKRGVMIGASLLSLTLLGTWILLGMNFVSSIDLPAPATREVIPEVTSAPAVATVTAAVEQITGQKQRVELSREPDALMTVSAGEGRPLPEKPVETELSSQVEAPTEAIAVEPDPAIEPEDPFEWIRALFDESGDETEYQTLFQSWGLQYRSVEGIGPERFALQNNFGLVKQKGSFGYLRRLNRPALLRLTDLTGKEFSATLTAIKGERVVLQSGTVLREVTVSALVQQWLGDFTMLWQPPPGYRRVIIPGDRGEAVRWLARQFEILNGREAEAHKKYVYDDSLQADVKAFQASEGLPVDGLAGPLTLIRLNSRINSGQPQLERIDLALEER